MVDRTILHEKLQSFDVAIVPLKSRIYGSVPSKIFEYGSLGFPILYFGGGEGEDIVMENNLGWIASVENYSDLNDKIQLISKLTKEDLDKIKLRIYNQAKESFNLDNQFKEIINGDVF
jgi:glycosyltransferase involved in cell wall biosynthesis